MPDTILSAYIECALWSSSDGDTGDNLDALYCADDLSDATVRAMGDDIASFLGLCEERGISLDDLSPSQIGHDFWLTRNRHGAGFWDRGLGKLGDDLTDIAHSFGESYLYAGDDGRVYSDA